MPDLPDPSITRKQLYVVVAPTEFVGSKNIGCLVLPAEALYLGTYSLVFGPATRQACDNFRSQTCSEFERGTSISTFAGDVADRTLRDVKEIVDRCAREVAERETVRERVERVGECLKEVLDRATEGIKEGLNN